MLAGSGYRAESNEIAPGKCAKLLSVVAIRAPCTTAAAAIRA